MAERKLNDKDFKKLKLLAEKADNPNNFIGSIQKIALGNEDYSLIEALSDWDITVNKNFEEKGRFGKFPSRGWFAIASDFFDKYGTEKKAKGGMIKTLSEKLTLKELFKS